MKYFSFGMNCNLDEMARRCPTAQSLGAAWINNYEFVFRTHADIAEAPGAICYGVLWDISRADLQALDRLEGYPYYYNRFRVKVNTGDKFVYAITYQMTDQTYIQEPSRDYLDMVREGYVQNAVPTNQIDRAINMVCLSQDLTSAEYPYTWPATTPGYA